MIRTKFNRGDIVRINLNPTARREQQDSVSQHRHRPRLPDETWDNWFKNGGCTADFMSRRDQPTEQDRTSDRVPGLRIEDWVP